MIRFNSEQARLVLEAINKVVESVDSTEAFDDFWGTVCVPLQGIVVDFNIHKNDDEENIFYLSVYGLEPSGDGLFTVNTQYEYNFGEYKFNKKENNV